MNWDIQKSFHRFQIININKNIINCSKVAIIEFKKRILHKIIILPIFYSSSWILKKSLESTLFLWKWLIYNKMIFIL